MAGSEWLSRMIMRAATPHASRGIPLRGMTYLVAELVDDVGELGDLACLVVSSASDRIWNAVADVMAENRDAHAVDGRVHGRELLEDVYAEPRLSNHPLNALDLAFDLAKPSGKFNLLFHGQHVCARADMNRLCRRRRARASPRRGTYLVEVARPCANNEWTGRCSLSTLAASKSRRSTRLMAFAAAGCSSMGSVPRWPACVGRIAGAKLLRWGLEYVGEGTVPCVAGQQAADSTNRLPDGSPRTACSSQDAAREAAEPAHAAAAHVSKRLRTPHGSDLGHRHS